MSDDLSQPATKDWIVDRWGGFDHLTLANNEDFTIYFEFRKLWLLYEIDDYRVPSSKLLLKDSPTRQDVLDAERVLGCGGVQ